MRNSFVSLSVFTLVLGLSACANTTSNTASSSSKSSAKPTAAVNIVQPRVDVVTPKGDAPLTLNQIMADPDWLGRSPESGYWRYDSEAVMYIRKREGQKLKDLWQLPLEQPGNGKRVALEELHQLRDNRRVYNRGRTLIAWVFQGNVFVRDVQSGTVKQLSKDQAHPHNLRFLNDNRIAFQIGNDIYALNPETGLRELLASWRFKKAPKGIKPAKDLVAQEQHDLIEVVALKRRQKQQKFDYQQQLRAKNASMTPKPFYLSKGHTTVSSSLSPDGKHLIIATRKNESWRDEGDIMPDYIAEDGRIKSRKVRRRVADAKPINQTLWLLDLVNHEQQKLSYISLPGYNEDVLEQVKRLNAEAKGEDYQTNRLPRAIGLISDWYWSQSAIQWYQDGSQVAIMLEAWDNKDRWIATVDFANRKLVSQHRLHDEAWINYKFNSFGWLNYKPELYFLSEQSGYASLYIQPLGGKAKALVKGEFEVDELTLTANDRYFYYQANKKHPGIYEIYRVDVSSGQSEALTDLNGMTGYSLSPDERKLLLEHSKVNLPTELYVMNAKPKAEVKRLTHTVSKAFSQINWTIPKIVPVLSSHTEQPIYSRLYLPKNVQQGKPRRAVIFNHGAGYLQNSHMGWSGYAREFMFHSMLAQQGYVVLDMDYRASKGYGRDWRTAIYRQMGTPEIQDLADGVNWLVENANVGRNRIGTYGGSYGGFMTFMALFTQPELFQAGAALRPVTDWAHYNTGYTSNILNTPDVDPLAYRKSSPIYYAEGLQKPLLINAPMVDDNVFFVDVVRLVQRLIELEKQDFETAIYPVEPHGFVQPSSWLDEYRRIYKLFEQHL